MSRIPPEIVLDPVQREQLEALIRASSTSQAEALRARIILLAAEDWLSEEIAAELQTLKRRRKLSRQRKSRPVKPITHLAFGVWRLAFGVWHQAQPSLGQKPTSRSGKTPAKLKKTNQNQSKRE